MTGQRHRACCSGGGSGWRSAAGGRGCQLTQGLADAVEDACIGWVSGAISPAARKSGWHTALPDRRQQPNATPQQPATTAAMAAVAAGAAGQPKRSLSTTHGRPCDRLCRCMAMAWDMGSRMLTTTLSQGKWAASGRASHSASCSAAGGTRRRQQQGPRRTSAQNSWPQAALPRAATHGCIVRAALKARFCEFGLRRLPQVEDLQQKQLARTSALGL